MIEQAGKAPLAWREGKRCYGPNIALKKAKKMLDAAEKEAINQGVPMVIAIVDAGGNLLAFRRMDNALLMSIQIAMDKAYTSVLGKLPTWDWTKIFRNKGLIPLFAHERWITFPGGFPILKNGVLMGGIGVSGGTIEDTFVAKAALEAGGFSVDEVDALLAEAADTKL